MFSPTLQKLGYTGAGNWMPPGGNFAPGVDNGQSVSFDPGAIDWATQQGYQVGYNPSTASSGLFDSSGQMLGGYQAPNDNAFWNAGLLAAGVAGGAAAGAGSAGAAEGAGYGGASVAEQEAINAALAGGSSSAAAPVGGTAAGAVMGGGPSGAVPNVVSPGMVSGMPSNPWLAAAQIGAPLLSG
jgi:hypothetical protein